MTLKIILVKKETILSNQNRDFLKTSFNIETKYLKRDLLPSLPKLKPKSFFSYYQAVDEVLTSVQKTEESLRRLKNLRDRNANAATTAPTMTTSTDRTTMSDDDKIRLQLQVDVIHYVQEIESIGLARGEIEKLDELMQLVEEATKIRIGSRM